MTLLAERFRNRHNRIPFLLFCTLLLLCALRPDAHALSTMYPQNGANVSGTEVAFYWVADVPSLPHTVQVSEKTDFSDIYAETSVASGTMAKIKLFDDCG